jgi:hypothetical protein
VFYVISIALNPNHVVATLLDALKEREAWRAVGHDRAALLPWRSSRSLCGWRLRVI